MANSLPSVLGGVYLFAIRLALAWSVVWIARRRFNLAIAVALAWVMVSLSGSNAAVPLAFIWCAMAIIDDPPGHQRLVLFGGGALSALELLIKLDEGLLITGMCTVAAITIEGRRSRNILSFGLTFLGCLLAFWFAAGQGISNADEFVTGSVQAMRGYSSAMGVSGAATWAVAALIVWAVTVLAALFAGRRLPVPRRLGLVLLVLGLGFVAWKEGFVRQDPGHMALYFAAMLAPWVAFQSRWRYPWTLACFVAVTVLYFAAAGLRPQDRLQPVESAQTMVEDLRTTFDPARRSGERADALLRMQLAYRLDQRTLALLRGKTVDVWPWETGIVWAYGLDWKPLPRFHTQGAYTSWLDQRNADALASPDGPQRILRHGTNPVAIEGAPTPATPYGIDGRYAAYDSPASSLAMLCNFEALRTTERYEVLRRVGDRCGPPRLVSSTSARYGQSVGIPRPPRAHDVVFARIHGAAPSGTESVRTFLFRSAVRYVVFNGKLQYRVVPNVLGDGLILDAPPSTDFPRRFALAPEARTVGLLKDSTWLSPARRLRFDFFAMRVRPISGLIQSRSRG